MKNSAKWLLLVTAAVVAHAQVADQIRRATITGSGGASGCCSTMRCEASKTSPHCPHRTQPSEILSWSGTTLNIV